MSDRTEQETAEEHVVPVVEERVEIGRKVVEGRTVSVTTRPVSETHEISQPVMREKVTVERVPVGEVIEERPDIREDGDLTVIPVVEERLVVTRQLVLKEEIHLRRTREETTEEHSVELRRTEVDISEQPPS
ncbi:DUF2382 domain-containing protein [Erythrobacter sp. HL-111]|uniref:DUF2382 domain-containing protein n=1 Tax=Erythrobacter sp. HL-111 TaxID=1798193 RepID=UPI0006DADF37|nr:DUF2382 domain-containing protein [Erythrobacter sp. HL-111]KPP88365.1 MAG: protein of unknown function containing DUF2382 domain [Erythrobacteraceae bacterium HL-111]SDS80965.1 protein of unknown function [Erythrobacter sp. HL-111]